MNAKGPRLAAVTLLVGLVASSCRSGGEAAATSTTRPNAATTTTAVTTTSTTVGTTTTSGPSRTTTTSTASSPRSTTTSTTSPPVDPDSVDPGRFGRPEDAATHLYNAWRAGDREKAALSGQPGAVSYLFSLPEYPGGFTLQGCSYRDAGYDCRFEGAAEALLMRVEGRASAGWRVVAVSLRA